MAKKNKYMSLNTKMEASDDTFVDSELIPVDILVMHDGLNHNNSIFDEKSIEKAKTSLKNKPILGYIEKNEDSKEVDFGGHEVDISLDDDGVKYTYLERPIGVVPETNHYSIVEEDGRNYVSCRGYLWKEYLNSGYEILKENPEKSVSMEIMVDDFTENEDGTINITDYKYLGITVLGSDVPPAMDGARLTVLGQFSDDNTSELYSKIDELNKRLEEHFQAKGVEGGEKVSKTKTKNKKQDEEVIEMEEELQKAKDAVAKAEETETQADVDTAQELVAALEDGEEKDNLQGRLTAVQELIDTDEEGEKAEGGDSTEPGDGEEEDYEAKFNELSKTHETLVEDYAKLEKEVKDLREFKDERVEAERKAELEKVRQEKIDHIEENYSEIDEDVKEQFIEKVDEYESVEDIDADICVYIVKNQLNFSKAEKKNTLKLGITEDDDVKAPTYGSLSIK